MIVDRKWVERNIGFDPVERPAPVSTFAFKAAASSADNEDLRREIIDFDSDATEGREFLAFTKATGLSGSENGSSSPAIRVIGNCTTWKPTARN